MVHIHIYSQYQVTNFDNKLREEQKVDMDCRAVKDKCTERYSYLEVKTLMINCRAQVTMLKEYTTL